MLGEQTETTSPRSIYFDEMRSPDRSMHECDVEDEHEAPHRRLPQPMPMPRWKTLQPTRARIPLPLSLSLSTQIFAIAWGVWGIL